ncbi:hypothetical protein JCM16358_09100 [Halanaerocella petrolearia]
MQYLDRFFVLLLTLLSIIISLTMMGTFMGWVNGIQLMNLINQDLRLLGIGGFILFLISLRILQLFLPKKRRAKQTIVSQGQLGTIKISLAAIENLVKEIVSKEEEVEDIQSQVDVTEEGVNILLNLSIISRANVSEIAEHLQEEIKEQVKDSTGAEVEEIEILINEVSREEDYTDTSTDVRLD